MKTSFRHIAYALTAAGSLALAGCGGPSKPATTAPPADCCATGSCPAPTTEGAPHHHGSADKPAATQSSQRTFATPEEAAGVLKDAAVAGDRETLLAIFGPEGQELVFSGDPVEEQQGLKKFATHLSEYTRVAPAGDGKATLFIGQKNWPFPIPLVKGEKGWSFDTAAGKEELLNRRVGENELNAISVCRAYVGAQKAYAAKDRTGENIVQYAQRFHSTEGKKDGLYWPAGENEEISPIGPLVAEAQGEGYMHGPLSKRNPYKGYFFHILTAQGEAAPGGKLSYIVDGHLTKGFALIAWPDSWGASGVMTFIINQEGKVFQKNLGEKTAEAVKEIAEYNPDATWQEVKD